MTTTAVNTNSASNSNGNSTVKLKPLVKLRSFKNQFADRISLRSETGPSSEQFSANESAIHIPGSQENTLNNDANRTDHYQGLSKIASGGRNDVSEAELISNNHSEDIYAVCQAGVLHVNDTSTVSEIRILPEDNKSTISGDRCPHSDSNSTLSQPHDFGCRKQFTISHSRNVVNNANVENNFQGAKSNTHELAVKSRDSQLTENDETDKELMKITSVTHKKQITPATARAERVTEACRAITRNCESSVTVPDTNNTIQDCNQSSNNVEKYVDGNIQITTSQIQQKKTSDWTHTDASERINLGLQVLKSELEAMREMDLNLLKQMITISQAIEHIQRADLMRSTRSMSFVSSSRNLQLRHRSMERQFSVPITASCRRSSFSYRRASTEDGLGDSLCSLDEADDGSQNQLEESNSSLNILYTTATRASTGSSKLYHDLVLSCDLTENGDETYEDILRRNIRLWKIGFQRQDSSDEIVAV